MKTTKINYLFILIVILVSCKEGKKEYIELHDYGITNQYNEADEKDGFWLTYIDNDLSKGVEYLMEYKNGVLHGEWKHLDREWKKNGKVYHGVLVSGEYKNGKKHGEWKYYSSTNINLIRSLKYKNGVLHGKCKFNDDSGRARVRGQYENGEQKGEWKYYYPSYNTNLQKIGEYALDSVPVGEWKYYHENGELAEIGHYENGQKNGEWVAYYDNSQLKRTGHWDGNGTKIGEWEYYYKNGFKSVIEAYDEEGRLNGTKKKYYENGELAEIGEYQSGQKNGEWKHYDKSGKLVNIEYH